MTTDIQKVVNHYFRTKGLSSEQRREDTKKNKIVYARFTRPAKDLIELAGSVEKANSAITKVAEWAKSRNLNYTIDTVFKKWFELDTLRPREVKKKASFEGKQMIWAEERNKWLIKVDGDWLEFVGDKKDIKWK